MDLLGWLRKQLDEDERVAKECDYWAPPPWVGAFKQVTSEPGGLAGVTTAASTNSAQVSHHIERWEPARVLVEIEAKRRILDLHPHQRFAKPLDAKSPHPEDHQPAFDDAPRYVGCQTCNWDGRFGEVYPSWWCDTVRILALPYATRDGYCEEWRP